MATKQAFWRHGTPAKTPKGDMPVALRVRLLVLSVVRDVPGVGYPYSLVAEAVGLPLDYFRVMAWLPCDQEREAWAWMALDAFEVGFGEAVGSYLRDGGDMPPTGLWDAPVRALVGRDEARDWDRLWLPLGWAGVDYEGRGLDAKGKDILAQAAATVRGPKG